MTPVPDHIPHWKQLARQIRRVTKPLACTHVSVQLPLFISDELAGLDVDALYPQVAAHLDLCTSCMDEYVALSEMLHAALTGTGASDGE